MPDGGWSFDLKECPKCKGKCSNPSELQSSHDRCGATGIALLPFLARGNTHQEGRYKKEVDRGIKFLADLSLKGNGDVTKAFPAPAKNYLGQKAGYSLAIAGMALAEAYGMTRDEQLLVPAQAVIDSITNWQSPKDGGWGYSPLGNSTTSIACMNALALETGKLAGLRVNPVSFKRFGEWLDSVEYDNGAAYGYKPPDKNERGATTAQGLLCRMYLGWKKNNPALQRGIEALAKRGPEKGNLYYSYYATQVMHHAQGPAWDAWNAQMKGILLQSQSAAGHETGSWLIKAGEKGQAYGGRLYMTAMATMILEVYYRHMSIYGDQASAGGFKD